MDLNKIWSLDNPVNFTKPPHRGRFDRLLKGGSAPAAPDPIATANAQKDANMEAARQTAQLSRTNEVSPFGTTTWAQDPNNQDSWTSTFQLDPQIQGLLDQYYSSARQAPQGIDMGSLPGVGTGQSYRDTAIGQTNPAGMNGQIHQSSQLAGQAGANAGLGQDNLQKLLQTALPQANEAGRKAVEDAYYAKMTSRLDPQYQQLEDSMRSRLANQGITEGSEAYNKELQQFMRGRTDAYGSAANDSIINSTDQMLRQLQGELAIRQQGLNESQGAMGMYGQASGIDNNNRTTQSSLYDAATNRAAQSQNMDAQARAQALNEQLQGHNTDMADRNNLLNQLMALRTGAQVNAPGTGQIQVGAAPVAQSIYNSYQGQVDAYRAAQDAQTGMWTGIAQVGASAAAAY